MNATRGMLLLVMSAVLSFHLHAGVGTWRSYTSMKDVKDVVSVGGQFWAASSGGLFSWQEGSATFLTYTNSDGLLSNDLTAVGADAQGDVWSGSSTGLIHALLPDGSWRYVLDIAQSNQTSKKVNRFVMYGDTALICTEFGMSMFDTRSLVFGDTYTKFGSLTNVRVSAADAAIFHDSIWVAISDEQSTHRIAVASLSNPNRLPPESWYLQAVGSATTRPTTLETFAGRLYAGTTSGLFYLEGGLWIPVTALTGKNIVATAVSDTALLVITSTEALHVRSDNTVTQLPSLPYTATAASISESGQPIVASDSGGVLTYDGTWTSRFPNGPNSNQFLSVIVDPQGNVWGASGINGGGKGFYRFDGNQWTSFTKENDGLPTNDYYRVSVGHNGSVWASSWGWGVVEIPAGAESIDPSRIFNTNVGMTGLCANTNYVVVTNVVSDPVGNEWMSINAPCDTKILAVRTSDGVSWTTLPLKLSTTQMNTLFYGIPLDRTLAVDAFGNLWGGSRNLSFGGVFSLQNGGTLADSIRSFVTDQDGLPSGEVTTLVVDLDNDIWVGTDRGIGIILDPLDPTGPGGIAIYKPLNGIAVNCIAVDALNQKWVGTPDGVVLLSSDGVQELASYTVESTGGGLVDNDVKAIAIDNLTGTVYFGTTVGLASVTTTSARPKEQFDRLVISPNPYIIPSPSPMTIDGLVENSTMKILTIDGRLVREIPSPGGRVGFWDGTGRDGEIVSTGVYLITAYSTDGSQIATGKVAVVRR